MKFCYKRTIGFIIGVLSTVALLSALKLINAIGFVDKHGNIQCPYGLKECVVPYNCVDEPVVYQERFYDR